MSKKTIALAASTMLLLSACTAAEQQQASDTVLQGEQDGAMMQQESANETEPEAMMQQESESEIQAGSETQVDVMERDRNEDAARDARIEIDAGVTAEAKGVYTAYTPAALTDGKTKVLFFHAGWCPVCKAGDAKLKEWYGADGFPLTVYKVDYDSNVDLRSQYGGSQYGVTYQHTFVKVDGQGNLIEKIQGPSDSALQTLLGA
jgi:thiol-disulfide isomerase/thioredoxin